MKMNVRIAIFLIAGLCSACSGAAVESDQPVEAVFYTSEQYDQFELIAALDEHTGKIWSLDFVQNDALISGGGGGKTAVWDMDNFSQVFMNADCSAVVEEVYCIGDDIFLLEMGRAVRKISITEQSSQLVYEGSARELTISPDRTLIAVSMGDSVAIYSLEEFQKIAVVDITDQSFDIRINRENTFLYVSGSNGKVQKYKISDGALVQEYKGLSYDVRAMEISADGRYVVAGGTDYQVIVWDEATGEIVSRYGHNDGVNDIDLVQDGSIIVSVGADRQLMIVDLLTGEIIKRIPHQDELMAVAISQNGKYIASGGYNSTVYIWGLAE